MCGADFVECVPHGALRTRFPNDRRNGPEQIDLPGTRMGMRVTRKIGLAYTPAVRVAVPTAGSTTPRALGLRTPILAKGRWSLPRARGWE